MRKVIAGVVIIMIVSFSLLGCSSTKCTECGRNHVVHDYAKITGIDKFYVSYSDVIAKFGEPDSITTEKVNDSWANVILNYGSIVFTLSKDSIDDSNEKCEMLSIEVFDSRFEFADNVKVGSTKKDIIKAYKNATPIKEAEKGCAFVDGWIQVEFTYDSNDTVSSIKFGRYL